MFMPKQPLSVTLEEENILWLRGRVHAGRQRSLSEALDGLVTAARRGGHDAAARSVVGTVDIGAGDPALLSADREIRALFQKSAAGALAGTRATGRKRPARKAAGRG